MMGTTVGLGGSPGAVGGLCVSPWVLCHLTLHTPSSFILDALFIWLAIVASILNMFKSAHFSVV